MILVLASEGYIINQWKPKIGSLMDQTLPSSSSPLEPYKSYVNFLHPLTNPSYRGAISGHQAYATIFWGGPNGGGQYPEPTGPTLDQVVAGALKPAQRKSLNFQVQVDRQPVSGGRGASHCHYTGPGQAINPELNPFKTYQTMFAGMPAPSADGMPDPAVQRLFLRRKSVLDYVSGNLTSFRSRVAAEDGKLIDQHLNSIRALEGELTSIATGKGPRVQVAAPANMSDADILGGPMANKIYPDIMHSYMDMIIAGLSAGVSHVGTLQISDATGKQVSFGSFVQGIPEIGTGYKTKYRNWHDLGHNPNFQGTNHKVIADKWCMSEFAAFIKKLQAITEPGGTMLDNSLVVWGNHMEDGWQPRHPDDALGHRGQGRRQDQDRTVRGRRRPLHRRRHRRVLPRLRGDARRQGVGRLPGTEGLSGGAPLTPLTLTLSLRPGRGQTLVRDSGTRRAS